MQRLVAAVLLVVALAGVSPAADAPGKGLIFLVRHAEREAGPTTDDVALTDAGKARAQRLAALLAKAGVKTVFVTRFRRTQETAKPLVDALRLTPLVESDTTQLVTKLRALGNETVLVIGHSDTVPDVIKAFGGPAVTIGDDEFDALFVLVPATGAVTRLAY